ncbi:MAG: sulfatase [Planctomycetota bacterium]
MPLEEVTIAETLKQADYSTFFAGKWHLGHTKQFWPEHQGFDINKGGFAKGEPSGSGKYFPPYGNPRLEDGPEGEHLPDRLAAETVKFLKGNKNKPFLACLSFYSVHTPLMARKDLEQKYIEKKDKLGIKTQWTTDDGRKNRHSQDNVVYAGMVDAMDQACGKVLDALKELGLEDNTIVIFMSDNGGLSTARAYATSNLPLRGGKGLLYEGGIREPMLIKWPGVTKAGSVCAEPVTSTDFYPTMLEIAGLDLMPEQHIDGVSLLPLLKGKTSLDRKAIYWHFPHFTSGGRGRFAGGAVRMGDYKLIEKYRDHSIELYNLKEDIGEKNNLAGKMSEKAGELKAMLDKWLKEVDAKMPTPNPTVKK